MGLDRPALVKKALGQWQACPVILIGGTNGKGSTCALLEKILLCAGYRVGLYTSPHLLIYNERVRINGQMASDAVLCEGFARVEAARGEIPLTYFEFGTLAAWEVFAAQPSALDVIILEVGLGGRLDATNLYEPDVSIVTSVDLDHEEYLGATREAIGFEKAGIFRSLRPAVCGDAHPPQTLLEHAWEISSDLQVIGEDFGFTHPLKYWGRGKNRNNLSLPTLFGTHQIANVACVLTALDLLWQSLPVTERDIRLGLAEVNLPGRFQKIQGAPEVIVDVAHNPQAARMLANNLRETAHSGATWGLWGMMRDKNRAGVVAVLSDHIDHWLLCDLPGYRAASAIELRATLNSAGIIKPHTLFASPAAAMDYARKNAKASDRIVAFGSFLTVAGVMTSSYGAT